MTNPSSGLDVVDLVTRALRASYESTGALVVPTILLDRTQLGEEDGPRKGAQLADFVLGWFMRNGFHCERSRVGGNGYGDIIKEIQFWYQDTIETLRDQFENKLKSRLAEYTKLGIPYSTNFEIFERMFLKKS